jgi:hypothetical protein
MATSSAATFGASLFLVGSTVTSVYADVAVLTAMVLLLSTLAKFGSDRIILAEVHAGGESGTSRGADILAFALVAGPVAGLAICTPAFGLVVDGSLSSNADLQERGLIGLWLAAEVIRLVAAEAHRSRYHFRLAAFSGYGIRAGLFLALLVVFHLGGHGLSRSAVLGAAALSSTAVCIVAIATVSRDFRWWRAHPLRSWQRLWGGHLSMVLTTLAATVIGAADIWMLGATVPHAETASYSLAVTLVAGLAVVSTAITGGLSPYVATHLARGERGAVESQVTRFVRFAGVLAVVGYGCLVLVAQPLATALGGDSYRRVGLYVALLGAGQVVNALAGIAGAILIVARRYHAVMVVTVSVAAATAATEAVFAFGLHSAVGVGVVSSLATALLPLTGCVLLWRILRIRTDAFAGRPASGPDRVD